MKSWTQIIEVGAISTFNVPGLRERMNDSISVLFKFCAPLTWTVVLVLYSTGLKLLSHFKVS